MNKSIDKVKLAFYDILSGKVVSYIKYKDKARTFRLINGK